MKRSDTLVASWVVFSVAEMAVAFVRQRMHPEHLKRSNDMLLPSRAGKKKVARPSLNFGKKGKR